MFMSVFFITHNSFLSPFHFRPSLVLLHLFCKYSMQIPISVISDALGHDSEKTTLIYLSMPDTSAIDNSNSEILSALEGMVN